jgi:hypothetical protein
VANKTRRLFAGKLTKIENQNRYAEPHESQKNIVVLACPGAYRRMPKGTTRKTST